MKRVVTPELLALNGYYTDLYNKQLLEEELAEVQTAQLCEAGTSQKISNQFPCRSARMG